MPFFFEDLVDPPLPFPDRIRRRIGSFSGALIEKFAASMASAPCAAIDVDAKPCRDDAAALRLKAVAIAAILLCGVVGVAIPLVGRKRRFLRTDSGLFVFTKAFAAGVILATGFVHMLPDGEAALTDPCLPSSPWSDFPFSGFVAMVAALGTLVVDFLGTQYYERKHREEVAAGKLLASSSAAPLLEDDHRDIGIVVESPTPAAGEDQDSMHIVGMHAHAAAHRHSHSNVLGTCDGHGHGWGPSHSHSHGPAEDDGVGDSSHTRHVVVSQILELGIVSHSVIIGLSLGVSSSPCTIRPLIGALSFHQFFEGFALGGCISQAQFGTLAATVMACFFAVTTPAGVAAGAAVASFYDPRSPRALVVEGVFDCVSAGILIYMALVDLIAADFLSRRMSCNARLQVASYLALFLGAASMSLLAIWA